VAEGRALPDHLKGHAIRGLQHIEREVGQQAAEIMERLETISEGCADVGRGSAD